MDVVVAVDVFHNQLSCYYRATFRKRKLNSYLQFPEELDMAPYLTGYEGISTVILLRLHTFGNYFNSYFHNRSVV